MDAPTPSIAGRLAIVDVRWKGDAAASPPPAELKRLTDALRQWVTSKLPAEVKPLAPAAIDVLDPPERRTCIDGPCVVELGKQLQSRYIVGSVAEATKSGLVWRIEAYDTTTGRRLTLLENKAPTVEALVSRSGRRVQSTITGWFAPPRPLRPAKTPRVAKPPPPGPVEPIDDGKVAVSLDTQPPGARVFLDDRSVCEATPCEVRALPGSHDILFKLEHHRSLRLSTVLVEGSRIWRELTGHPGTLSITSEPKELPVRVNDVPLGPTPLSDLEAEPGTYTVVADDPCLIPETRTVQVAPAQKVSVSLRPARRFGDLLVRAIDADGTQLTGDLWVDGQRQGPVPGTYHLPVCTRAVEVRSGSYLGFQTVHLVENELTRAQVFIRSTK